MPTLKRVSMREIADAVGVSVMTVSLALRGQPHVAAETRDRVLKMADKMGYRPDPALSALVAYRSVKATPKFHGLITYLNCTPYPNVEHTNQLHTDYFEGACERARELGYRLEPFWLNEPGMTSRRASQILSYKQVAGILVAPVHRLDVSIDLEWERFVSVSYGFSLAHPKLSAVSTHNFQCISLAMEKIVEYGYKRVGLVINKSQDKRKLGAWSGAYLMQQRNLIKAKDRIPILSIDDENLEHFEKWYKRYRPDAVLVGYTSVIDAFDKMGLRIGEDVGVVLAYTGTTHYDLAHVDHNNRIVGREAMNVLSGFIYHNEKGLPSHPVQTLVDGEWKDGYSLPDKR
ncbi:LacI family DNA-binding transcriptional regulator [Ruficoccus sp. ZRK36]|uniref:LacI family DNA-binding transcriptional regulator n=1 Tax=Ruficoccus sp. ZRK36 TaxID=2866311 RepID=UPI001C7375A7|nr:LacI family DNA-binding transcriptional regulator [Ruficoccus sp. ZRK36]QYY37237.1 LacI family transcriptional regulator [Ruficoccus sp. ZRK36]